MDDVTNIDNIVSISDLEIEFRLIFIYSTIIALFSLVYSLLTKKGDWGNELHAPEGAEIDDISISDGSNGLYPNGELMLIYGTQTGSAEVFCRQIEMEAQDHGYKPIIMDLGDCAGEDFREYVLAQIDRDTGFDLDKPVKCAFLVSTYGEGEPPDTALPFCELITAKADDSGDRDPNYLAGFEFCVFALGSTEYEHFAACGKLVDQKLGMIGAHRIVPLTLGDDNQDIEGDFEEWKENKFWPALDRDSDALKQGDSTEPSVAKVPFVVDFVDSSVPNVDRRRGFPAETVVNSARPYFESYDCPIKKSKELRKGISNGSTLHIDIDISRHLDLSYETADNLAVLPINDIEKVQVVANKLGLSLEDRFVVEPVPGKEAGFKHMFPTPCTVEEYLSRYCDITSAPRRSELKALAAFAADEGEKQQLMQIASSVDFYHEAIVESKVGLVDLITSKFPSVDIPFSNFVNMCPRLQPRYYTISSSSSVSPNTVSITVSVLDEKMVGGGRFKGVCSNHLANLKRNGSARIFIRPSTFRLPQDTTRPIILIGPGTGIAPMRALLHERAYQKNVLGKEIGKNVLYFGCKKRNVDYLYSNEIEAFKNDGIISDLHLAFSRERRQKVYVQYLLAKNKEEVCDLVLNKGAYIYVCGATAMGQEVRDTLTVVFATYGNMGPAGAREFVGQLQSDRRLVQELWA
eukprot:CAMPEP_0116075498 /NCGR_PEP_ID=MMETSP0322-20121206/16662_1 /TAXON_ID=163516 /ORGANISM="Leptocylindrus danicus var. apora, Strain B651" /LENGTH=689 /DNA_ID=CAMNT_0003565551 /DNA_START=174 /DNA_END=2243 /DNA_ORIENTATION=+